MPVENDIIKAKGGVVLGTTESSPAELAAGKLKESQVPIEIVNGGEIPLVKGADSTGTTDSTAAILASMIGFTCRLPPGKFKMALGTLANFDIEGAGPEATKILPQSGSEPILSGGFKGNNEDNYSRLAKLTIENTSSRLYNNPLIDISLTRNLIVEDLNVQAEGTICSAFRLNSSYQYTFRNILAKMGRWGQFYEWLNTAEIIGGPPQCDTAKFDQVEVTGPGPIYRNSNNDLHGFGWDGLKVRGVSYTAEATERSKLSSIAVVEAKSIKVESSTGINVEDLLTISPGTGITEYVRVISVEGTTINLHEKTPIRFEHPVGSLVLQGAVGISIGSTWHALTFLRSHFEKHQVGFALGNVQGVTIISPYSGVGQMVMQCGETSRVRILAPEMLGTAQANEGFVIGQQENGSQASGIGDYEIVEPVIPAGVVHSPAKPSGYFPNNTRRWKLRTESREWVNQGSGAAEILRSTGNNGGLRHFEYAGGHEDIQKTPEEPGSPAAGYLRYFTRETGGKLQFCIKSSGGTVTILYEEGTKLSRLTPLEQGRSAEMTAGEITIAAPAVTATGAIVITTEGGTAIGASVVERTAGTGFKVKATATSIDRVNWIVYSE